MQPSYNPILIGTSQIFLEEVDSTNSYMIELLSKNKPSEGLVVFSDFQSQGRGQIGSKWESEKGQNILTSIFLQPTFLSHKDVFYLNIIVSLAVRAVLEDVLGSEDNVKVKWPNDIYINNKKVCGVLVQNTFAGANVLHSVIGIGLNVNQKEFTYSKATSIANYVSNMVDIEVVRKGLYYYLEQYYNILKTKNFKNLFGQYESYLYHKNQVKRYQDLLTGEVFQGIILGVENDGRLIVQTSGMIKKFAFKEIKYL